MEKPPTSLYSDYVFYLWSFTIILETNDDVYEHINP